MAATDSSSPCRLPPSARIRLARHTPYATPPTLARPLAPSTEYAGNIIPAIATTNAIIAGVLVHQALHFLRTVTWPLARTVWLSRSAQRVFILSPLPKPNDQCSVCRVVYLPINFKEDELTLGEFVKQVVVGEVGFDDHVTVSLGSKLLFETEDFEDNEGKTMKEMGFTEGTFLTVVDDDDHYPIEFSIGCVLCTWSPLRELAADASLGFFYSAHPCPRPPPPSTPSPPPFPHLSRLKPHHHLPPPRKAPTIQTRTSSCPCPA